MSKHNTEDLKKWEDFVVQTEKANLIPILLEMYEKIDEKCYPHYRIKYNGLIGFSIRMYSPNMECINALEAIANSHNLQCARNPKQQSNNPLESLSGWFDDIEVTGPTYEETIVLHTLSDAAINTLRNGFRSLGDRTHYSHQFANMLGCFFWYGSII